MTPEVQAGINKKCTRASERLQREKYALTGLTRGQFNPCAKGLVYTAAIGTGKVMSEIENEVVLTVCECHPNFDYDKAIEYECEA